MSVEQQNGENGHTEVELGEKWTVEQLVGEGPPPHKRVSLLRRASVKLTPDKGPPEPADWGRPGHLSKEEAEVYVDFQKEVESRGGEFRKTVYCFGLEEGEAYTLTRWLRARKFVYDDVIKMVEEATECRATPREKDYYPDPVEALGCSASLFYSMYPQLYTGHCKAGAPLFISKPGILNVDGMECITTLDGIVKFHWHVMMHDFAKRLRERKESDPDFKRFECFCVLDLAHLSTGALSKRALDIVKEQSFIDSLCFPETMARMIIVNAPRFFVATWHMIKGWIDVRTASKVEVISNRKAGEKRLLELVDADLLPSDYGGKGPDTNDILNEKGTGKRLFHRMLYLRGHDSVVGEIAEGEEVEISVYTRSTAGAVFAVTHAEHKHGKHIIDNIEVKHTGSIDVTEKPTSVTLTKERIAGPAKIKVKADSNAGRFATHNYVVVFSVF